ncbi:MAG: hypothetical protein SF028_03970 [Candidatus Sumerlaeia bacterium]|nr:hypothetical protein [Candidatus Sumerlaeia bacterium]
MNSRPTNRTRKRIAVVACALAAGAALAVPLTTDLFQLFEDSVGSMGGGIVSAPTGAFISTHNGAIVSGHGATVSGFTVFMGPSLEPTSGAFVAEGAASWVHYE